MAGGTTGATPGDGVATTLDMVEMEVASTGAVATVCRSGGWNCGCREEAGIKDLGCCCCVPRFREDVGSSAAETERTRGGALRVVVDGARDFSGIIKFEDAVECGLNGGKKFGGGGATYRG